MKNDKISTPPIPLKEAIEHAANWRNYCKELLKGNELPVIKAFFIPLDDLMKVVNLVTNDSGKEVAGMRVYFRLENQQCNLSNLQAMIVPVIYNESKELKDWTQLNQLTGSEDPSLVFDFTKPCPTECDEDSPLSQLILF